MPRPVALVTGVGRREGIGAAVALKLAEDGWDVATSHWRPYDERMPWGPDDQREELHRQMESAGAQTFDFPVDLSDPAAPQQLFDAVIDQLGHVTALVMSHAESVDSSIRDTTVESSDRHYAVNARASWLLIRAYAEQFEGAHGTGRIVALTSDHTAHNLPYVASKGALDRIVVAAAVELADLGVTSNSIDPGPTDTGWMSEVVREHVIDATPLRRLGRPEDAAELVAFICSAGGGWINGQVLKSNGGFTGFD